MENVEGQAKGSEGSKPNVKVEDLMAEIQQLKASRDRILEESKGYKNKYQEVAGALDAIEREKLEKEGKTEEILLKERDEKAKLMESLKALKSKTLKANVVSTLAKLAKDAHSIDDLLSLKQASMIEYDEESLEPLQETVEKFVNTLREEKPYLFGSKKVTPMADGKPSGEVTNKKTTIEDEFRKIFGSN